MRRNGGPSRRKHLQPRSCRRTSASPTRRCRSTSWLRARSIDRLAVQVVAEPHALVGSSAASASAVSASDAERARCQRRPLAAARPLRFRLLPGGVRHEHIRLGGRPGYCTRLEQPGAGRRQPRQPAGHYLRGSPPGHPRRRHPRPTRRSAPARRTGFLWLRAATIAPYRSAAGLPRARSRAHPPRPSSNRSAAPPRAISRSAASARRHPVARPVGTPRRPPAAGGTPSLPGSASGPPWTGCSTAGRRSGRR